MQVRQVVTGHDDKGRSVIARDENVDAMSRPGVGDLALLWSADEPATYPDAGDNPAAPALFPPVGGIRFIMATYYSSSTMASRCRCLPEMPWSRTELATVGAWWMSRPPWLHSSSEPTPIDTPRRQESCSSQTKQLWLPEWAATPNVRLHPDRSSARTALCV